MYLDLSNQNPKHIETGFLAINNRALIKVEQIIDLSPGGLTKNTMTTMYPYKDWIEVYDAELSEEDVKRLLSLSHNKIKKYRYDIEHENTTIYINRYTLGIVTIDIDAIRPIESLPEYIGKEVTDDNKYHELSLSLMREELRETRDKATQRDTPNENKNKK